MNALSYYQQPPPSMSNHKRKRSMTSDREADIEETIQEQQQYQPHPLPSEDLLESTLPNQPWTFLATPVDTYFPSDSLLTAHTDSLIVSTKGLCKCAGRPWADGAIGVFFHPSATAFNQSLRLPTDMLHTKPRAELYAGILALRLVAEIRARNPTGRKRIATPTGPLRRLRRVVVKTDSAYMANDMAEWIYNWQTYGCTSQMRANLGNADLFRELEDLVVGLYEAGVQVQFACVGRERNEGAEKLASAALEEMAVMEAVGGFASYWSDQDSDDSPMMM